MVQNSSRPLYVFDEIDKSIGQLHESGHVVELRIITTSRDGTIAGYFDDLNKLSQEAARWSGKAPAVYATLNPCHPALFARAANRLIKRAKQTTSDHDIIGRRWLPIDFDPVRPSGISSTDEEHQSALQRARDCRRCLVEDLAFPTPLLCDSGNGAHLLFRIDLPNDKDSRELVQKCLQAIELRFSDDAVAVDTGNYNAARIWKLYGTLACKGDHTEDRPHRLARVLEYPDDIEVVHVYKLQALAAMAPLESQADRALLQDNGHAFNLDDFIAKHGIELRSSGVWNGGRKFVLGRCVWNPEHDDKSAYIVQFANGSIAAGCHHNGCQGKGWHDLRDLFEPDRAGKNGSHQNGRQAEEASRKGSGQNHEQDDSQPIDLRRALLSFQELLTLDLPERKMILPWLPAQGMAMVYGTRGIGKTQFALSVAITLASGTQFLSWEPEDAVGVLYVDGEMPLSELLERTLALAGENVPEQLYFLPSEMVYHELNRDLVLTGEAMRNAICDLLDQYPSAKVLVLDNISCLFSGISEDKKQDWEPVNAWLIRLRHRGISTLLVHHAGKGGGQRGTSAREDILDTVIALCEPEGYSPEEGCHFHLRFTKARALKGDVVKPLDVTLKDQGKGLWTWEYRLLEQSQRKQIIELLNEGITSPKVIHEEVGCTERYVRRIKAEWDRLGNKAK